MVPMTRVEALLEEVLALPTKDRARLVEELTLSLDPVTGRVDDADAEGDELDEDTRALIEQRIDNMIAHPERAKPLDEAMASIRAEFERLKRP